MIPLSASFQDQRLWRTFMVDLLLVLALTTGWYLFGQQIQQEATILQAIPPEQIQQLLVTQPQEAQAYFMQLKSYMIFLLGGGGVLVLLSLLAYSYAQAWIWNFLHHQHLTKKNYWRWNLLQIVILLPLLPIILGWILMQMLLRQLSLPVVLAQPIHDVVTLLFLLALLLVAFVIYSIFTQRYRVWESIGIALSLMKKQAPHLGKIFVLALLLSFVLSLLLQALKVILPFGIIPLVSGVFLLFISWYRLYVFRTLHHG